MFDKGIIFFLPDSIFWFKISCPVISYKINELKLEAISIYTDISFVAGFGNTKMEFFTDDLSRDNGIKDMDLHNVSDPQWFDAMRQTV